jgi:hypothetical protein
MLAVLIDFGITALKGAGPLVLWVFIWSAIYAGLERIYPRLGGRPQ